MKNKSKKIILVLSHKYFENKDIDMFDINEIKRQGFDIEIWELVRLIYNYNISKPLNYYGGKEVIEFQTIDQLNKRISKMNMKTCFFILYPGEAYDDITNTMRKQIVKYKGNYANYHYPLLVSTMPDFVNKNKNIFDVFTEYISSWKKNHYKLYSDIKIIINTFFYPSTYEFIPGEAGFRLIKNNFIRLSKKCILLHSFDMDTYIRNKKRKINNELLGRKYVVFIDEYLEGHSDFKKEGCKPPVNVRERYYTELNNFFTMIEKLYDCEVVIALHPKAEYVGNPFEGRKMIINQTHTLIENAALCILHDSTCYPFILFCKKPYFQIITSDLIQNSIMNMHIMEYEKQGFSHVCDISSIEEQSLKDYVNVYNADVHDIYIDYFMGSKNNSRLLNMTVICQLIRKELEKK